MRLASLIASVALCACEPAKPSDPPPAAPAVPLQDAPNARWFDLANNVAMLAASRPSTPEELAKLEQSGFSRDAFRAYIRDLAATPEAAKAAVDLLNLDVSNLKISATTALLKHSDVDGATLYYLRTPCARSEAVEVKPWWDMTKPLLVCPSSYKPDVFGDGPLTCAGLVNAPTSPTSPCGCGPNLIRCVPDDKLRAEMEDQMSAEHRDTIAYIASHDLPIQTIFTSNESFRKPLAEFGYQRWRIESQEVPSLESLPAWSSWPADGKWAPRYESRKGEHAGITTNNLFPEAVDALRLKLVTFYTAMWCDVIISSRVSTSSLLDIAFHYKTNPNFRTDPNTTDLPARPVCTNCHARLDYGSQFYRGWTSQNLGLNYDPRRQLDTPGKLYLDDIHDYRGEGPRNPAGFVKLALAQPEYAACMANEFTTHVFGKTGVDDNPDLMSTLEDLVRKHASYRTLLEKTLDAYTDKHFADDAPAAAAPAKDLVAMVDDQCSSCHDADDKRPPGIFAKYSAKWCEAEAAQCPKTAFDMLTVIANRRMPKSGTMSSAERIAMIQDLAGYIWPDAAQRARSTQFFIEEAIGGHPIHSTEAILNSIYSLVPNAPHAKSPVETFQTFGTSLAAQIASTAARECSTVRDPSDCMRRALDPNRILK